MKKIHFFTLASILLGQFCLNALESLSTSQTQESRRPPMITIDNTTYCSPNFSERNNTPINTIVLHYTATKATAGAAQHLVNSASGVSSNFLVPAFDETSQEPFVVYELVDLSKAAWHAGISKWRNESVVNKKTGNQTLNYQSIGIEIVNWGYERTIDDKGVETPTFSENGQLIFSPYDPQQIEVLAELLKNLIAAYNIKNWNIVAHSDIALSPATDKTPSLRKKDVGGAFPWEALARMGIGMWPGVIGNDSSYTYDMPNGFDLIWTKKALERVGYNITDASDTFDVTTKRSICAFRLHYQPNDFDYTGNLKTWGSDAEKDAITQGILSRLISEYGIPPVQNSIFENSK